MKQLKIKFVDFDSVNNLEINPVYRALSKKYKLIIDDKNPDIVVCGMWGNKHIDINVPKIYFSAETYIFNNDFYDVYIGGIDLGKNKIQYNVIADEEDFSQLQYNKQTKLKTKPKTQFCAFIYRNYHCRERIQFCKKLMKYKMVDCYGSVLNNKTLKNDNTATMAYQDTLINTYSNYKFVIAFENKSIDGYVCEKISMPLYAGAIPIYWGANDVADYINQECFINVNDFNSFDDCIDYVKKVDNDDKLYQKYINAKPVLPNSKLNDMTPDKMDKKILSAVEKVLDKNYIPVGRLTGYNRLRAIWLSKSWKYKQSVSYRFEILLEFLGLK